MTHQQIKAQALALGYVFSDEDCEEVINSSYEGETVADAVNDYLNAYER